MQELPMVGRGRCLPKKYSQGRCAFSLIEVVFALGIAAFALVILIALLPVGLQANRESHQESTTVNLINALIADLKDSPKTKSSYVYQLPPVIDPANINNNSGGISGIQASSAVTKPIAEDLTVAPSATDASVRYLASVTRQQVDTSTLAPVIYTISVTPAPQVAAATRQGIVETSVAIPQQ